jgi:hypothetical protein
MNNRKIRIIGSGVLGMMTARELQMMDPKSRHHDFGEKPVLPQRGKQFGFVA